MWWMLGWLVPFALAACAGIVFLVVQQKEQQ